MKNTNYWLKILGLTILSLIFIVLFLTYNTHGNWAFAFSLRGKKVATFIVVALATSISTISFQTLTGNQFLTPGILGLDNLYVFIQTILFFFVGGITMLSQESLWMFFANVVIMTTLSVFFLLYFLEKTTGNLFLLLMVGMVSGTLFSSLSTFMQVLMDPNEYDLLQGKLFASFSNVNSQYLLVATLLIVLGSAYLWYVAPELNVLLLGNDQSINLGIQLASFQTRALISIILLTGVATALVGPTIFLGFIVATISYRLFDTYQHHRLFLGSFLVGILLLVSGQFLVEQIFHWRTTISIVIQFVGGVFFLLKIIAERRKS
ncbi:iron chelate uptake ABC transporter family permease subunit [Enterococcus lemanii]|uniref:Iron chelate uptake ABC transporter family permease subunit n=1 Tax=Enterococcus lemanii TaxID=1159752 RepID=A0ABV9MY32_9ENTE|nr:iron chelate uptake ABC transporter family permease subunit [Enterococcus lemanii]MBM7709624.1 iron complex transport system permease protein [Enterococcus lemanii]